MEVHLDEDTSNLLKALVDHFDQSKELVIHAALVDLARKHGVEIRKKEK